MRVNVTFSIDVKPEEIIAIIEKTEELDRARNPAGPSPVGATKLTWMDKLVRVMEIVTIEQMEEHSHSDFKMRKGMDYTVTGENEKYIKINQYPYWFPKMIFELTR